MSMSTSERQAFLADVRVGVLAIAGADGAGPLAVPIWYSYQPGGALSFTTGAGTRKARAIAAAGRFSLCVQDEQPPYRYVTVEGPAVIERRQPPGAARHRAALPGPAGRRVLRGGRRGGRLRQRGDPDDPRALADARSVAARPPRPPAPHARPACPARPGRPPR